MYCRIQCRSAAPSDYLRRVWYNFINPSGLSLKGNDVLNHLTIRIFGDVIGVNYRSAAREAAEGLGITGFARNEPGNCVYIEAEGEEAALRQFVDWCRTGSARSKVGRVEVWEAPVKNFTEFKVMRN